MTRLFITCFFLMATATALAEETLQLTIPKEEGQPAITLEVLLDPTEALKIGADGNVRAVGSTPLAELCSDLETADCQDCDCDARVDISSFSINGESNVTVSPNSTLTFSWASRGAWDCAGTGLPGTSWNDGDKLPIGSEVITSPGLEPGATYTPTLRCENGPDVVDQASVTITVTEPAAVPEGCEGRVPEHMTRANECIHSGSAEGADCFSYREIFGSDSNPFPGPDGSARNFALQRDEYAAMQFIVPENLSRKGSWDLTESQFGLGSAGGKLSTISKCPGDFDKDAIDAESTGTCYVKMDGTGGIVRFEPAGGGDRFRCDLEPGETYYLNIVFTDSASGTPPNDLNWRCPDDRSTCGNRASVITSSAD